MSIPNPTNLQGVADHESIQWSWDVEDDPRFVMLWATTASPETITIPTSGAGYDCEVLWGDGSDWEAFSGTAPTISHEYATAGEYTVKIRGAFPYIRFANGGDKLKIKEIQNWGNIAWTSFLSAFQGCTNLSVTATDVPDLSSVTTMFRAFTNVKGTFSASIGQWDVSNITNFYDFMNGATEFNVDIGNWQLNQSGDITLQQMLQATKFNQDISNWKTARVNTMISLFIQSSFNQPINTDGEKWDVSNVTSFTYIFGFTSFNQSLSNWNTSSGLTFNNMFQNNSAFKQDISNFNFESATNVSSFLASANINETGTTTNYDKLLISIAGQNVNNSLSFHGGTAKYSDGDGMADKTTNAEFARWSLIAVHASANADASGTDKSTYDAEAAGFQYWDTSALKIWIKRTATSADWIGPFDLGKSWTITDGGLDT